MVKQDHQASASLPSPTRRIIPQGFATAALTLTGTSPILMNSAESDRDSDLYRTFWMLGQKKRKTLDDNARLRELEWQLAIYFDEAVGPYVPGRAVKEMLRSAATKWAKGEELKRSLIVVEFRIPLDYTDDDGKPGPRGQKELWDAGYRYTTMVANAGFNAGRVLRCRPMFANWSLTCTLAYDPEDLDPDLLANVIERSQKYGLLDYRPARGGDFGTFIPSVASETLHYPPNKGIAVKSRNGHEEAAHDVFVDRILAKVID